MITRKSYRKEFDYSYTLGAFPTFELVTHMPEKIMAIVIHSASTIDIEAIRKAAKIYGFSIEVDDKLIKILSPKNNCYMIGFFKKETMVIESNTHHLVLDNPSNHGNFGTIIRSALGFQLPHISMIEPGIDFYHPQVIRSSMGAIFSVTIESFASFDAYEQQHPTQHIFPFILGGKKELSQITFPKEPISLVFGNEATGLDARYQHLGESVYIAHDTEIDSLNLPMAVAIALYQLYSQANAGC